MGKMNSGEQGSARFTRYMVFSLIFLFVMVLTLAAFSGYLCFQLKYFREEFEKYADGDSVGERNNVFRRERRQATNEFVTSVAFIHWGSRNCPQTDRSVQNLLTGNENDGIIAAFHSQTNNVVPGSDMLCVPKINNITRERSVSGPGLKLLPVNFDLYRQSRHFQDPRNRGSHLSCAHCFVEASDVVTLIGRSCLPGEWNPLYSGFLTTSSNSDGTTQSICVASDPIPAGRLSPLINQATYMIPVMSAFNPILSVRSGARIPCNVCYRKLSRALQQQGIGGPIGSSDDTGVTGSRGSIGATGTRGVQPSRGSQGPDGAQGKD